MKELITFNGEWGIAREWLQDFEVKHLHKVFARRIDDTTIKCTYFEYRKFMEIADMCKYHHLEPAEFGKNPFDYYDGALEAIKQHYIYVLNGYVAQGKELPCKVYTYKSTKKGERYWVFREVEVKESEVHL